MKKLNSGFIAPLIMTVIAIVIIIFGTTTYLNRNSNAQNTKRSQGALVTTSSSSNDNTKQVKLTDSGVNQIGSTTTTKSEIKIKFDSNDNKIEIGKTFNFSIYLNESNRAKYENQKIRFLLEVPECVDIFNEKEKKYFLQQDSKKTDKLALYNVLLNDDGVYTAQIDEIYLGLNNFSVNRDCFINPDQTIQEIYPVKLIMIDANDYAATNTIVSSAPFRLVEAQDVTSIKKEKFAKELNDLLYQSKRVNDILSNITFIQYSDPDTGLSFSYPNIYDSSPTKGDFDLQSKDELNLYSSSTNFSRYLGYYKASEKSYMSLKVDFLDKLDLKYGPSAVTYRIVYDKKTDTLMDCDSSGACSPSSQKKTFIGDAYYYSDLGCYEFCPRNIFIIIPRLNKFIEVVLDDALYYPDKYGDGFSADYNELSHSLVKQYEMQKVIISKRDSSFKVTLP